MNYQSRITTSGQTAAEATGDGNIYVSSFVDVSCFFLYCVCYAFERVSLYLPCCHLLGRADLLALVCGVLL